MFIEDVVKVKPARRLEVKWLTGQKFFVNEHKDVNGVLRAVGAVFVGSEFACRTYIADRLHFYSRGGNPEVL